MRFRYFLIFLQQQLAILTLNRHVRLMRFVLSLGLIALLGTSALAAPWDIVPIEKTQTHIETTLRPVHIQRGGSSNALKTIEGLNLNIVASGLGNISAMTVGEGGVIITADAKTGRLWALTDRGQDGKIDMRRPLPFSFKIPSGLAMIGSSLYVADQIAIWVIEDGNPPRELASLRHANSIGEPHILTSNPDGTSLTFGLTTKTQDQRILQIDSHTGQATLMDEGPGHLHALAQRDRSEIWAAVGTGLTSLDGSGLKFQNGQSITAIALPGQYTAPEDWPAKLKDHIIATQIGPDAMRLIAIPTEFGQVSGTPRVLADGFIIQSGRSAWGEPGAMLMDKRGLFFADKENGTLWRLSPKPRPAQPAPKITIVDTASLPASIRKEPNLANTGALKIESSIQGTQIDASSTIIKPSSIEYGSKLIKDYDEKKAQEATEKAEEEPKKKRRISRKRKQPDD